MPHEPSRPDAGKFMSSVKVGPKGQIVIPKEARELFGIAPGDTLLLLADVNRGIAIHRQDYFDRIADEIFSRPASSADEERFAHEVEQLRKSSSEEKR